MSDQSYELLARQAAARRRQLAAKQQTPAGGMQSLEAAQARLKAEQRRRTAVTSGMSNADLTALLEAEAMAGQSGGGSNPAMQAALLEKAKREKARRANTTMTEQTMSGVNEGIAGILGGPVDLMTGAINMGKQGLNALAGTDFQPINNPVSYTHLRAHETS